MRSFTCAVAVVLSFSATANADCAQMGYDIRALVCPRPATIPNPSPNPLSCENASPDAHKEAVQGAFVLAPAAVKEELCRLKQIFILEPPAKGQPASWGLWQNPQRGETPQGQKPESYIGLARNVVEGGNVIEREDSIIRDVTGASNITHSTSTTLSGQQPLHFSILSVIAHEIGHIKWHRDNIYSSLPCYWDEFVVPSWEEAGMPAFRRRAWAPSFREGASRGGALKRNTQQPPGNFDLADVKRFYTTGFATAVGAISPEEDFVEAYRVATFRNAEPTLELTADFQAEGSVSVTGNSAAISRFECLERWLF